MTLIEIFEYEIEKLGGYRATYHIIKVENSRKNDDKRRAEKYFNNHRKTNKLWKPSEIRILRDNIDKNVFYLMKLLKRSENAIRFRKHKERKMLCLTQTRKI